MLQLLDASTGELVPNTTVPDRREAWIILNAIWHQRVSDESGIGRTEPRTKSLSDIVHSTGSARVGALCAVAVAFSIVGSISVFSTDTGSIVRFVVAVFVAILILLVHHFAYVRSSTAAESLIAEVFEDTLTDSALRLSEPVRTHVALRKARVQTRTG